MTDMKLLREQGEEYGIMLNDMQLAQFEAFYRLLIEWNGRMNLTAITDREQVIYRHFADSLMVAEFINFDNCPEIIDIGTGAGFPGIPLKIAFPNIKLTLMDSLNKRINFLNAVIGELKLADVTAIHGRAEEYGRDDDYRERYDVALSRAVANLTALSEYCIPFVKKGGLFISYKAGGCEDEIREAKKMIRTLGGRIENNFKKSLITNENESIDRQFIFIRKDENTPAAYPRRTAVIKKYS